MAHTTSRLNVKDPTRLIISADTGKAGATAGWTTATNNGAATCAAGSTNATFTIPINGLSPGDVIKSFKIKGGKTGSNSSTLDASLRKLTPHATDGTLTDAQIAAATQFSSAPAAPISVEKTVSNERVYANYMYYLLLTATTGATSPIAVQSIELEITKTLGYNA